MNNISESDYFIIPNPIYDVVFRYLMEDSESSKIVLSTLLNENIIDIQLQPTVYTHHKDSIENPATIIDPKTTENVRLSQMDFTATVLLNDGTKELIMIELQRASEPDDIFRFKRYISKNFQTKQKGEVIQPKTQAIIEIEKPIRLIPVFILNFKIENEVNDLLVITKREKLGVFKNLKITKHNEFIDNLTYDIIVVQLPNIQKITEEDYKDDEYKKRLYTLLKLFDQKSVVTSNEHRLRLYRKFFPGFLDRIIHRLQAADIMYPELEEQMFIEDEYLKALIRRDNTISFMEQKLDENKKTIEEKDKTIEEKEKTIEEKEKTIEEKEKTIKEKERRIKERERNLNIIKKISKGISIDIITKEYQLTVDEINKILE